MTYPFGGADRPSANSREQSRRYLQWAVLVLGLATYCVSYGPTLESGAGWAVRFSVLAGVVAALGLLPPQSAHTKWMAGLAAVGFLEALSQLIVASDPPDPGWAMIVIVVLNGLQAVVAIGALLTDAGVLRERAGYSAAYDPYAYYAYYAQAAQQDYAARYQHPEPDALQQSGAAQAEEAASVEAQQAAAERYAAQYAEYWAAQQPAPNPHPTAGFGQAAQDERGAGLATTGWTERPPQRDDSAGEPPTQSWPS